MIHVHQSRARLKIVIFIFSIAFIIAGIGLCFYFFRDQEPTHGVFVYNYSHPLKEGVQYGYLYTAT